MIRNKIEVEIILTDSGNLRLCSNGASYLIEKFSPLSAGLEVDLLYSLGIMDKMKIKEGDSIISGGHYGIVTKALPFDEFILRSNGLRGRNSSDTGVQTLSFNGEDFEFMYLNNKMPEFYTDVGNLSFIFDSYLDTEDNTLQQSKTMCGGLVYPTFTLSDTFYPPLDPTQFSYYINKAKARAFIELKQHENKEAASEARRQKIITQVRKDRTENLTALQKITRYGR